MTDTDQNTPGVRHTFNQDKAVLDQRDRKRKRESSEQ